MLIHQTRVDTPEVNRDVKVVNQIGAVGSPIPAPETAAAGGARTGSQNAVQDQVSASVNSVSQKSDTFAAWRSGDSRHGRNLAAGDEFAPVI